MQAGWSIAVTSKLPPARLLFASLMLGLNACGQAAAPAQSQATTTATTAPRAVALPAKARELHETQAAYEFTYSYPAAAASIAPLKAWLEADLAKARQELIANAKDGADYAHKEGIEFHPFAHGTQWQVVADLPQWLSLSAMVYSDTGGAHPNHGRIALLWDKQAGQTREMLDLFTSPAAFAKAVRPAFCDALDRERSKRRGQKVNRKSGEMFDECIDPASVTIIPGASKAGAGKGQAFDRLGFLIDPYAAGPYAEGDYEVTLPVTPQILAVVKPAFAKAFVAGR